MIDLNPDAGDMRRRIARLEAERETIMALLDALEAYERLLLDRVLEIPAELHRARDAAHRGSRKGSPS